MATIGSRYDHRWVLGHIYDMKNQFWAGLGSRASTWKKSLGPIMSNFWGRFFLCFHGQKINLIFFWKYCRVRTEKLHRIKVNKSQKVLQSIIYGGKPSFFYGSKFECICMKVGTRHLFSYLCTFKNRTKLKHDRGNRKKG